MNWRDKLPTTAQRRALEAYGEKCPPTRGEASDLLAQCVQYWDPRTDEEAVVGTGPSRPPTRHKGQVYAVTVSDGDTVGITLLVPRGQVDARVLVSSPAYQYVASLLRERREWIALDVEVPPPGTLSLSRILSVETKQTETVRREFI